MEDILENGGFRFKETVMAGDPLEERGELRKVLGLRWDTQEDKICVDIRHQAQLRREGEGTMEQMRNYTASG
jgi:hypothetical protein